MAVLQPTLHGLPGKSPLGGYLYVIRFSVDIIKVGRTIAPAGRFHTHYSHSRGLGISVTDQWVSSPHSETQRNETSLVEFCQSRAEKVNGREYFAGLRFDEVIRFAETLPYVPLQVKVGVTVDMPDMPRWRQAHAILTERIRSGVYRAGDRVPSVVALSEELDISTPTAQKALKQLREDGLTYTVPGFGSFVAGPSGERPGPPST